MDNSFSSQQFNPNLFDPTNEDNQDYIEFNHNNGLASAALEKDIASMEDRINKNYQSMTDSYNSGFIPEMPTGDSPNPASNFAENNDYYNLLANVESRGNYNAKNKSGAYGKYQFMPSTEKEYAKKLGITIKQARTPEGQENMIRKFTKDNINGLRRHGVPVTKETMWWAHNQGLGGAVNLYKGGKVSKRNLASNGGKNSQEYITKWRKIFGEQPKRQGLAGI